MTGPGAAGDPPQTTSPMDEVRLAARLTALGYHVAQDEDGDLFGLWGADPFWFLRMGRNHEILQVRGRWHRTVPAARRAEMLLVLNDWNRDHTWPKAYLRSEVDRIAVYGEVAVDLTHGATDDQLDAVIRHGLAAGGSLLAWLAERLPDDAAEPD